MRRRPAIGQLLPGTEGIETGKTEIIADDISRTVLASLSGDAAAHYPQRA